jgi:hypothetical protein
MNETEALRPAGLAAGEFVVPDDFDEPLPDDLLNRLRGSMKLLLDSGVWDLCNKGRRARAADLELAQLRAWVPSALDRSKADAHADRATRRTILG